MTKLPSLFSDITEKKLEILYNFDEILQSCKPLTSKQLQILPEKIRELSHQLTDERGTRRIGYMNETSYLIAYSRYYMWWNLIRLTSLFGAIPENKFSFLNNTTYCLDIGSGPLTLPIALWLSHPELRTKQLTWYCLDQSQTALSLGEEIYLSIVAKTIANSKNPEEIHPWKIIRVKGSIGTEIRNPISFVTCANMFNELYWNTSSPLEEVAKKYNAILTAYTKKIDKSSPIAFFVAEPGIPRASRFITLLRDSFIRNGLKIVGPCPHEKKCPMDGRKGGKWCHFVLLTENAPQKLHKLSKAAGIPKERASISYVFASNQVVESNSNLKLVRIASDPIRLPYNTFGRYACAPWGLSLVMEPPTLESGDLLGLQISETQINQLPEDKKTKAKIIKL